MATEHEGDEANAVGNNGYVDGESEVTNCGYYEASFHSLPSAPKETSTPSAARYQPIVSCPPASTFGQHPKRDESVSDAPIPSTTSECTSSRGCPTEWNALFQEYLEMSEETEEKRLSKYQNLGALSANFVHTAKKFGKIIIAERSFEENHRTLRPDLTLGGKAGGEKYHYHGIIFKFATDWKAIYGNDRSAMKAAGHELKSIMRYAQCPGLHVPLMAIIDYRGYRVIATSELPINNSSTLCYGSSDGGNRVYNIDTTLSKLMEKAGKRMNLKGHYTGLGRNRQLLFGPVDIEGHLGSDDRFYVLDFARTFPPTAEPGTGPKSTFLYKLLRPEFVKTNSVPLSSDGFSAFGQDLKEEHESEIEEATARLLQNVIPHFATTILPGLVPKRVDVPTSGDDSASGDDQDYQEVENISEKIHRVGINVRYLGLVRHHAPPYLKPAILNEICAREIKNQLREIQRETGKKLKKPNEDEFRGCAIDFLNLVLARDIQEDKNFWEEIKSKITISFGEAALAPEEVAESFDLRKNINIFRLFKRVQRLTGVKFTKQAQRDLKENPNLFKIVRSDISKISARVKHMNIITLAEAQALAIAALKDGRDSERLFRLACTKFETAIQATPDSSQSLSDYAEFLVSYARVHQGGNLDQYKLAFEKFKTAHNYAEISRLAAEVRQISPRFIGASERFELLQDCYDAILKGREWEQSDHSIDLPLLTRTLIDWGYLLVAKARHRKDLGMYEDAGSKFCEAMEQECLTEYDAIRVVAPHLTKRELAVAFELLVQSPSLEAIDLTHCFRPNLMTGNLLFLLMSSFLVNSLRLVGYSHPIRELCQAMNARPGGLVTLNLRQCPTVNDECLRAIRDYCSTSLTSLDIANCCHVTAEGLEQLSHFTNLTRLDIAGCQGANDLIANAPRTFPDLRSLRLAGCDDLTEKSLESLARCEQLRWLDISRLSITELGFTQLQVLNVTGCKELKSLRLLTCQGLREFRARNCYELDSISIEFVGTSSDNLKLLDLYGCHQITDSTLTAITSKHTALTRLDLNCNKLTPAAVVSALQKLPILEHLTIANLLMDPELCSLQETGIGLPKLKTLSLTNTHLKSSITCFVGCTKLETLILSRNSELGHEALCTMLNGCERLQRLELSCCIRLTDATLSKAVANLSQLKRLNLGGSQGNATGLYCKIAPSLVQLRELEELSLQNCEHLVALELQEILENCHYLRVLDLSGCRHIDESILPLLENCLELTEVTLEGTKIGASKLTEFCAKRPDITMPSPNLRGSSSPYSPRSFLYVRAARK